MLHAFIHGFLLAFGLIIPLGAQNIFIFDQGVNQKRFASVLPTIFTAIVCDSTLIISAVLGVSLIVFAIPWLESLVLYVGMFFLIYLGFITWFRKIKDPNSPPLSAKKQILFTASLSFFNPHALLDTIGVIGTSSVYYYGINKYIFTFACVLVSIVWFFALAMVGHFVRKFGSFGKFTQIMNKISACIIWAVALYIGSLIYFDVDLG